MTKALEFEDILKDVGHWGRFQKSLIMFFGVCISAIAPFAGLSLVFMVMIPRHSCYVPSNVTHVVAENNSCGLLTVSSTVLNGSVWNSTESESCIYGWQYDNEDFESTVATKWDLVCEYSHYPSSLIMLQNIGSLIGTPIYSAFADRFGRKSLCFVLLFLTSVTDLSSIFVDSFLIFAVLRTINGSTLPTIYTIPYILISEFMPPNKRVLVNGVFNLSWMTGLCILPLVAYLVKSWTYLAVFNSICFASLLLYWRFVPESASWLISQKRYEDATKVMTSIGKKNKILPKEDQLLKKLKEFGEMKKNEKEEKTNILSYLKFPRLRKHLLILTFCWISNSVAYFGFQYNVINLAGNVFLNFFLLSIAEAPGNAFCWIMMEKLGRRWTTTVGLLGIALSCLLTFTGFEYADIASSVIGKLIASGVFMVVDQQGCELFPTVARSVGIGTGKSFAAAALLFTPFLAYLSMYNKIIPFAFICVICFAAAFFSTFLPETLNENLPQTFSDADNFGENQKYFSFNRKKKPVQEPGVYSIEVKDVSYSNPIQVVD